MFDIEVQNGSIPKNVALSIRADIAKLSVPDEAARMRIVANRRADAANPRWAEDVRERKLCCANGKGTVHGLDIDLDDYGIGLDVADDLKGA